MKKIFLSGVALMLFTMMCVPSTNALTIHRTNRISTFSYQIMVKDTIPITHDTIPVTHDTIPANNWNQGDTTIPNNNNNWNDQRSDTSMMNNNNMNLDSNMQGMKIDSISLMNNNNNQMQVEPPMLPLDSTL